MFIYIYDRHNECQTRIVTFRRYKKIDADKLKYDLLDKIHSLSVNLYSNIEELWASSKEVFELVCNNYAPL